MLDSYTTLMRKDKQYLIAKARRLKTRSPCDWPTPISRHMTKDELARGIYEFERADARSNGTVVRHVAGRYESVEACQCNLGTYVRKQQKPRIACVVAPNGDINVRHAKSYKYIDISVKILTVLLIEQLHKYERRTVPSAMVQQFAEQVFQL